MHLIDNVALLKMVHKHNAFDIKNIEIINFLTGETDFYLIWSRGGDGDCLFHCLWLKVINPTLILQDMGKHSSSKTSYPTDPCFTIHSHKPHVGIQQLSLISLTLSTPYKR